MNYNNVFDKLLRTLSKEALRLLQLLDDLRGANLEALDLTLGLGVSSQTRENLSYLEQSGLILRINQDWVCTWEGTGLANWSSQLTWARGLAFLEAVPEPRPGENGRQLGPPCSHYRPALFWPGHCWCGRPLAAHLSEVIRAAEQIISGK